MPDKEIVAGEFVASLLTVTLPVTPAALAGVNVTLSVAVCPGVRICPLETPLAVNPAPEMLTFETLTLERFDPPGFDTVTDWDTVLPTATGPKLTDGGDIEMAAAVVGVLLLFWLDVFLVPVRPTQPESKRVPKTRRYTERKRIRTVPLFEEIREFADSQRTPRMNASLISGTILRCPPVQDLLSLGTDVVQVWNTVPAKGHGRRQNEWVDPRWDQLIGPPIVVSRAPVPANSWDPCRDLIRKYALHAAGIHRRHDVEVCSTRQDGGVRILSRCNQRGIQLRVWPTGDGGAVAVISGNGGRASSPVQCHGMRNGLDPRP